MKHRCIYFWVFSLCCICTVSRAQNKEAQWSIDNYHHYYGEARKVSSPEKEKFIKEFRLKLQQENLYFNRKGNMDKQELNKLLQLLQPDGKFSDLDDSQIGPGKDGNQANSGGVITEAYQRLWFLANAFKENKLSQEKDSRTWKALLKSIVHYGNLEISRPNNWARFHASCFALPKSASGIYFCLLQQMDIAEAGGAEDKDLVAAADMLKIITLQSWTQPVRNDDTDLNVVQVERFRNHVWWVGGNGLGTHGYRAVYQAAFIYRSIPMLDLLAEVCQRSITTTSQATYHTSFWNEGFTADGAGWGHGVQCLIWGYPIHGTSGALEMLGMLKDSPWKTKLTRGNVEALMNYFRGGNFYYYKGYTTPCLDRNSMAYAPESHTIPYRGLLSMLLSTWRESFTDEEVKELELLQKEVENKNIRMEAYDAYNGTHYFFNNDDLVKKNDDYYIMVNMASVRCDGIESAHTFADAYNFYTTDGTTFFEKTGNEYKSVLGGFDVTAMPGCTAREGMERLTPVTNWRGYTSKHNFAAAATAGGENAVAGYIFEKMNGSEREGVNDKGDSEGMNAVLYGVKAYKSYFMLGDYMVALGAGITNLDPNQPGTIRTTIDQTAHTGEVYTHKVKGTKWIVQQGKFAYSVLPEYQNRMHDVCEQKKADWVKMNVSNRNKKDLPQTADIFRIWIDHGQKPVNDSYGYVVYAGKGEPKEGYPFKVLRNDTLVQAVESADKKVIEAVFYTTGETLKASRITLSVSAPCTVLVEKQGEKTQITVTDACMDKECKEIRVTLNGKSLKCPMPQGERTGAPATVWL